MEKILSIFKTTTLKQSGITLFGTLISGVLGAIFYITVARFLGPVDFGILIITITTLTLLADIADLGISTSLVRFVSSFQQSQEKAYKFLKISLKIKLLSWTVVLIIGNLLVPFVASNIFSKPELILPLRLSLVGVGGALLLAFATSSLQAFQKFVPWSLVSVGVNLVRLLSIIFLLTFNQLNLMNSLAAYIILPFLGFSLGMLFLPTKSFLAVSGEKNILKELFEFNKWVALFILIAAFSSRLDTFLNTRLLSVYEVGIYGVASQLTSYIPQLVAALGVVAAPKFASFTNKIQMVSYLKKFTILVSVLSLLGLLILPIVYYLMPVLLGAEYLQSRDVFAILFLSMLVFLVSMPVHTSVFYYFSKPQVFVWVSIGHLLVVGSLGLVLIPVYGIMGTAITMLVGSVFNFIVPLTWVLAKIRKI